MSTQEPSSWPGSWKEEQPTEAVGFHLCFCLLCVPPHVYAFLSNIYMWVCSVESSIKEIYITTELHSVWIKAGMYSELSFHLNPPVLCHNLSFSNLWTWMTSTLLSSACCAHFLFDFVSSLFFSPAPGKAKGKFPCLCDNVLILIQS